MARPLRLDIEDGWYHVTSRGTERRRIFTEDRERFHLLDLLAEMTERYGLLVHAYVLLDNHFHLLIQTPRANCSAGMQWLKTSYSMWFNRRHERVGPLFQGRFKAVLVDGDGSWALLASIYLHLNPVRVAGLGLDKQGRRAEGRGIRIADKETIRRRLTILRQYRWSSYRAYASCEAVPEWLSTDVLLSRVGGCGAYRRYAEEWVTQGAVPEEFAGFRDQWAIGSTPFLDRVKQLVKRVSGEQPQRRHVRRAPATLGQIVRVVEEVKGESWAKFHDRHGDWGRDLALYLARRYSGLSLGAIGEGVGGLHYKAVGKAVQRFARRAQTERRLSNLVKRCTAQLTIVET